MTGHLGASSLQEFLKFQKENYLEGRRGDGGTAQGFRDWVQNHTDVKTLQRWRSEALAAAATKTWQMKPRNKGPDLFDVNGYIIPQYITRSTTTYVTSEDIADAEERFEKVSYKYATVGDLRSHYEIHARKSVELAAAVNDLVKCLDEVMRRAAGDLSVLLRDIV